MKENAIGCLIPLGIIFFGFLIQYLYTHSQGVPQCMWSRDPITCTQIIKIHMDKNE